MNETWINGRPAGATEADPVEHGRSCERERELALLAGLLAKYPRPPEPAGRPVTDISLGELP